MVVFFIRGEVLDVVSLFVGGLSYELLVLVCFRAPTNWGFVGSLSAEVSSGRRAPVAAVNHDGLVIFKRPCTLLYDLVTGLVQHSQQVVEFLFVQN